MTAVGLLAFAAAAGVGGLVRWSVGLVLNRGRPFPAGTFAVNVVGAFALGLLATPDFHATVWGAGLLGATTTFSTFAFELVDLVRTGQRNIAVLYASATFFVGLAAAAGGVALAPGLA